MLDLQKASMLKRISAFILDAILLCILSVGFGSVISAVTGFDGQVQTLNECYTRFETEFGIDFDITREQYDALTQAEKEVYDRANDAMGADEVAQKAYHMVISLSLTIVSLGILLACLVLEFAVPLIIGNGQTMGKRIFSIGLMRADCVKVSPVLLFIRTVLGKYTVSIMVPVLVIMMILLGTIGIVGPLVVMGVVALQAICMIATSTNSAVHDLLSGTVVVDVSSQMIFGSESELIAYKKRTHLENTAHRDR